MTSLLTLIWFALSLVAAPAAFASDAPPNDKVLKAIDAWLKHYRAGKIDFASTADIGKESFAQKFGVLPKGLVGALTARRDLEVLLEQAAAMQSAEAAEAILAVAAIGLDHGKVQYRIEMAPSTVRSIGENWLGKLTAPAATEQLLKYARGEARADKTLGAGMEAAAVRWIGVGRQAGLRPLVEQRLAAAEFPIRLAAAEALQSYAAEEATTALTAALERETNDVVVGAIAKALRAGLSKYVTKAAGTDAPAPPPPVAALAVRAATAALGRTSWRADLELVDLLAEFRTASTIPVLIDVLQRFKDRPEEIQSGRLSGLLLYRTHEALVAMTGAVFPADAPEKWRELWESERERLLITAAPAAKSTDANTVVRSFCGIPVQGTRILFIVDLSGSMNFPMRSPTTTSTVPDRIETNSRLDFAKKQLSLVVESIPEVSHLNFITYNGEPKAKIWNKDLLLANKKNKQKALEFIAQMRADGGTNMWSGLELGLKMKSLVYGDRYETALDEIFVVSDGAPNVGEVTDPAEILRLVTETNRFSKVRINTIFITSPNENNPRGQSMSPSELMRRMAEQNGGKFVEFNN